MPANSTPQVTKTRTLLLVDDQPEFLQLARLLLSQHPALQVIGEAESGERALDLAPLLHPDAAVVDVHMPGMSGFEVARQLLNGSPGLRVILVSAFDDAQFATLALRAGAVAFITKKALSPEAVLQALDTA